MVYVWWDGKLCNLWHLRNLHLYNVVDWPFNLLFLPITLYKSSVHSYSTRFLEYLCVQLKIEIVRIIRNYTVDYSITISLQQCTPSFLHQKWGGGIYLIIQLVLTIYMRSTTMMTAVVFWKNVNYSAYSGAYADTKLRDIEETYIIIMYSIVSIYTQFGEVNIRVTCSLNQGSWFWFQATAVAAVHCFTLLLFYHVFVMIPN